MTWRTGLALAIAFSLPVLYLSVAWTLFASRRLAFSVLEISGDYSLSLSRAIMNVSAYIPTCLCVTIGRAVEYTDE